ncbi:MAG: glycosyl hydrolase [candidate division KSB1 bacterium]|nr:glycosyl hydrolase [candidate division KSB1 bacterium]
MNLSLYRIRSLNVTILAIVICTLLPGYVNAQSGQALDVWPEIQNHHKPACFWWWPGNAVDSVNIDRILTTMHATGIGGVSIVPIYGVKGYEDQFIPFLSSNWLNMLQHTLNETKRLGMWVDMSTGTGWPYGGPHVTLNDADARVHYENGELSQRFSGRKVKRAAPGGEGFSINPYSPAAMRRYLSRFDSVLNTINTGNLRAQYHDSFEYSGNWCTGFFQEFKARRDYDLEPHLGVLFGGSDPESRARIKSDYRKTLSELHLEYMNTWHSWSNRRGHLTRNQAHGAPANLLDVYAACDIPETETFGASEFDIPGLRRDSTNVSRQDKPRPLVMRMASSAAHVTGKTRVSSESCTWLRNHFNTALSQIKPEIDQLFLCGVNQVIYHGYCYSPQEAQWPGWLFYASIQMNSRNSIWKDVKPLNDYIARCQSVLQSGKPANDILLYWPVYDIWHDPDGLQKQLKVHDPAWIKESECGKTAKWLIEHGYAFDYISDHQLRTVRVEGEHLWTADVPYQTVLIPETQHMPVQTLRRLLSLAEQGADIVFIENLPKDVPGFYQWEQRRKALQTLVSALRFENAGAGKDRQHRATHANGRIYKSPLAVELFNRIGIAGEDMCGAGLEFIRRRHPDGMSYFIANLSAEPVNDWISPAVAFQSARIMDPLTAETGVAPSRGPREERQLFLQLQPGQSLIVRTFKDKTITGDIWPVMQASDEPVPVTGEMAGALYQRRTGAAGILQHKASGVLD